MKAIARLLCWFILPATLIFTLSPGVGYATDRPDYQIVQHFFNAIAMNETNLASELLEAHTNLVLAVDNGSKLPLLEAAAAGNVPLVKRLLELGADVNAVGDTLSSVGSQQTALHFAIQRNKPEVCKLLLESRADPNRMAFGYTTPLHLAFHENREAIAALLLDHGADPFREKEYTNDRTTPVEVAVARGTGKLIPRILQEARVKPGAPKSGAQLLKDVVRPPFNPKAARLLATRGPAMLAMAAQRGQLEAVEAFLDAGVTANSTANDAAPVLQAFARAKAGAANAKDFPAERWSRIRELLEKNGAAMDVFAATGLGDVAAARRLLSANAGAIHAHDNAGQTPLHWAVDVDRLPMTSFWLEAGASPAATNFAGQTALHLAAAAGRIEHLKLLLAANAPTTARDTNGLTPLDAAIKAQQTEAIRLLLGKETAGARPERGVVQPIHKVAEAGNLAALTALAGDAGKLESRNELGLTPLQVAVRSGHLAAAALLVDQGADVNARDPEGNTMLQQILSTRLFVQDRPPASWLARAGKDSKKQAYLRFFKTREEGQEPDPVLQAAAFLLLCGVDVSATNHAGKSVVQMATDEEFMQRTMLFDEERTEFMKLLGAAGANLNAADDSGDTPLHLAGNDTDADRAASLIAAGADINATNHLGQTPLHKFVEHISGWDMNEDGDGQPFQLLLKRKANVNAQDNEGLTPLHVLAKSESSFKEEATKALLAAGAKPNLRDKHGRTPAHLFLASKESTDEAGECLALLVKRGADLSVRDDQGQTPLHYLAKLGDGQPLFFIEGITNLFAARKVDISARDAVGDTPLHIAARSGTSDVFEWLAKRGASLDATNFAGETPRLLAARSTKPFTRFSFNADADIFQAIREGKLESVDALIKADESLANTANQFGQTPLRLAVISRRTNIVEFLEQHGAIWDAASAVMAGRAKPLREILANEHAAITNTALGKGLLHIAAANGDVEIVQLLISAGADLRAVDAWGLSPLGCARLQRQPAAVTELLRGHGAEENIFDAAYNGDAALASALLADNKSLAQATNQGGLFVVEVAAGQGPVELLQLLLDKGAKADVTSPRTGRTLLHISTVANQPDAAELLIRRGVAVTQFDKLGFTPLHLAAFNGSSDTAAVLLRHKADLNALTIPPQAPVHPLMFPPARGQMLVGNTPLHLAALFGQTNVIPLLLKSGAPVNATNAAGRTALDLASPSGMPFPFLRLQLSLGPAEGPTPMPPQTQNYSMAARMERQRAAATMLEQAGGTRSPASNSSFRSPGF